MAQDIYEDDGVDYDVRLVKFHNGDDVFYAAKRVYYDDNGWPSRIEEPDDDDCMWNICTDDHPDADYYGWESSKDPSYTTRKTFP